MQPDDRLRGRPSRSAVAGLPARRGRLPRDRDRGEPVRVLDRSRARPGGVPADADQVKPRLRHDVQEPRLHLLRRRHPGLQELVTIGKVWELAQLDRSVQARRKYDLVIVDAPATGHGIGFLRTPKTFGDIARVGRSSARPTRSTSSSPTQADLGRARSHGRRRCRSTRRSTSSATCTEELGLDLDRIYMNGIYPALFTDDEA